MSINSGNHNKATIAPFLASKSASKTATIQAPLINDISRTNSLVMAAFAFGLGLFLLSVVGYAQAAHDVAHDARHTFSFPCH